MGDKVKMVIQSVIHRDPWKWLEDHGLLSTRIPGYHTKVLFNLCNQGNFCGGEK